MKLASFLASASASLLLATAVTGCGDDPTSPPGDDDFTAEFAGADADTLRRAAVAGEGGDGLIATFSTMFFAGGDDPTGCPRIVTVGNVTTISGPCSGSDNSYEGVATLTNVPNPFGDGDDHDPSQPSTFAFEGFRASEPGDTVAFDGEVVSTANRLTVDLVATVFEREATSALDLSYTDEGTYTANAGSWIDVAELGSAEVTGTWTFGGETPAGSFTLRGVDTITFDFDDIVGDCVPYLIDGAAAGELCDPGE